MRENFLKLYRWYGGILYAVAMLGGISTFSIMMLTTTNSLTRKVFNAPVPAAMEICQSLLVLTIMLPFAYTLFKREHVKTTVLTSRLPQSLQRWLFVLWMTAGFMLFAIVVYGTFQYALRSYRVNEQVWGAMIQFPLWPSKMAISFAALLLSVQFLLDAVGAILYADFHHTPEEAEVHANV